MTNKVLVTGGTGFLATNIIIQLLEKGYDVKTTVRNLSSKDKIITTLKSNNVANIDMLSFAEADLSSDENWLKIMKDRDYVLSVASPVFFEIPKYENEVMKPAIEGIIRILRNARDAGVKRVVMTSNFGAVGFSQKNQLVPTTENDWTNPEEAGLSAYEKSKLLAEKAAWDFIKNEGNGMEFTTVNPVAIFGPALSNHLSGSFDLFNMLLDGKTKAYPNLPLNIVDVRDVADIHIRAMENSQASGQRFIASADGQISMEEIAKIIREKRPQLYNNVTKRKIPNWIITIGALFNKQAKEGKLMLSISRNVSNDKVKSILDWNSTRTNEEIILSSIDSMLDYNLI
ncbi:3-beta hydroxysteroid dehydrogenase [Floricoccus penangensis]|uniref:3-beta hydroxysteroid dehydrogenase n=1 Tax=Floricoccus penangensis TaxID=1859475 RepID=A0A9Q5P1R9_9LACT|nr:aldehyde reductase [Floricoccus penangensis]OFI47599.1 3-beta hydroxysteroid dehydrogenase [Floricoccus penangensis]